MANESVLSACRAFGLIALVALPSPAADAQSAAAEPTTPAISTTPRYHAVLPANGGTAQSTARRIELTGTLGFSTFIDEDFIEHVTVGVAVRVPLTRRLSIEPRFLYMHAGSDDQDYFLMGSLVYDLETRGPVSPYLTIGGGVFWNRSLVGSGPFVSSDPHVSGGGGARIRLAERWSLVTEARLGFEPLFQVQGGLGYSF